MNLWHFLGKDCPLMVGRSNRVIYWMKKIICEYWSCMRQYMFIHLLMVIILTYFWRASWQKGNYIPLTRLYMLLKTIMSKWRGPKDHHLHLLKVPIRGLFLHVKVMIVRTRLCNPRVWGTLHTRVAHQLVFHQINVLFFSSTTLFLSTTNNLFILVLLLPICSKCEHNKPKTNHTFHQPLSYIMFQQT
jgi:hypothetical protein